MQISIAIKQHGDGLLLFQQEQGFPSTLGQCNGILPCQHCWPQDTQTTFHEEQWLQKSPLSPTFTHQCV